MNYIFTANEIRSPDNRRIYGWINKDVPQFTDCIEAIKDTLEKHGYKLDIKEPWSGAEPALRPHDLTIHPGGMGVDIQNTEIRWAFFYKDLHCVKSVAKAVFKVMNGVVDCGDDPDCEQCPNPCIKNIPTKCDYCPCPKQCSSYERGGS